MSRVNDIDRKLAIFYHPLYQEVVNVWCQLFSGRLNALTIGFLNFIEFNIKLQKCLLPSFELQNAFISALNDWLKEVTECFSAESVAGPPKSALTLEEEHRKLNFEPTLTWEE